MLQNYKIYNIFQLFFVEGNFIIIIIIIIIIMMMMMKIVYNYKYECIERSVCLSKKTYRKKRHHLALKHNIKGYTKRYLFLKKYKLG